MIKNKQAGAAGQAAALPEGMLPDELLPLLDKWMAEAGMGADHPWRAAIAKTMADWKGGGRNTVSMLETVFAGISGQAKDLMRLVNDWDADNNFPHAGVVLPCLGRIGWLADLGLSRSCGWAPAGTDGGEWMLTAYQAKQLKLSEPEE